MLHMIFDTETTNLVHNTLQPLDKQPKIIEFYGTILDDKDWSEVATLHQVLDPKIPISKDVTRITGFKDDDVRGKPEFKDWYQEFINFADQANVAVAHNLSYDMSVIDFEFARIGKKFTWPAMRLCTVEATESMKGFRLNLNALHTELFGEGFTGAHKADADVKALARCYIELVKRGEIW